ncbi:MAG TPA: VWA domain-containing protein [Vicinamibacterales bacterium]|nr:VWA domain-containing protein [Vicinamibacterales bacterium]
MGTFRRRTAPGWLCGTLALMAFQATGARTAGQFRSSVELVEVYASVSDAAGTSVRGLQAADFEVLEDGRPQPIQAFAAGDFPLSLAIALDHSASMAGSRLVQATSAVRRFLGRLRPEDQVMLLGIAGRVEVLAPLSTDRPQQHQALDLLRPWSTTSLYDALIAGVGLIQPAGGRRALVVLSDGEDRYSEATPAEVLDRARHSDVLVYPLAIGGTAPRVFAEVAAITGGRSFAPKNPRAIDEALASLTAELRDQYLLGYAPPRADDGRPEDGWRSITVRVRGRQGLRIRARDGYFAKRAATGAGGRPS